MSDARSKRKATVVKFLSLLDKNCGVNLQALIDRAKQLELEGFENVKWDNSSWEVTSGRLLKQSGTNVFMVSLNFNYAPKLGGGIFVVHWTDIAKALFVLRFHRKHQSASNQRNFITAVGYVAYQANKNNCEIFQLTHEHLDNACRMVSEHYGSGAAYNLHKHIAEFAAHCDANKLCRVHLDYKYSRMKRPESTGGLKHKRLDDPEVLITQGDKFVTPELFRLIGELYKNVPTDHKYRFYILILTLLACLGRRFSEITLLPCQTVRFDEENRAFIEYFPRKMSHGDTFTPKRRLYLPTETVGIVDPVLSELNDRCAAARTTAAEMQKNNGPDLTFISNILETTRLYTNDLEQLGLSGTILLTNGWIRKNGYAIQDHEKLTAQNKKPNHPILYTSKKGVIAYCRRDYSDKYVAPIHVDQNGYKYYLKDMLLVRHLGLSSGAYSKWISTQCTHSMMTTFLRYLPDLANEYTTTDIRLDFNSHNFRHTLNTLLDEGGLSDLLQTEWFGRANPKDTKAYQHTSREKRALMLREDIKKGNVGGQIAEQIKSIPIVIQDAYLKVRINAVHDVGTGICVHNFAQTPCERHLQCSADCKDYVWVKGDKGREDDLKRQYAMTVVAQETAEKNSNSAKAKKSVDWIKHNDKKINTLTKQLADSGIAEFNAHDYLERLSNVDKV